MSDGIELPARALPYERASYESMDDPIPPLWEHPTGQAPKRVCLVGLGATQTEYITDRLHKGKTPGTFGSYGYFDETWTINRGLKYLPHDLVFVLDDLLNESQEDPDYAEYLRTHDRPMLVHAIHPDYPAAIRYPYLEVMRMHGHENFYYHNSVPLIIAYALYIGVEELVIFGCDYTHMQSSGHEDSRANAEYWVGYARAKGMRVGIVNGSTLCDAHRGLELYGHPFLPPDVRAWLSTPQGQGTTP